MTYEMYEVKIEVTGKEMQFLVWWLVDNISQWDISLWYNIDVPNPRRSAKQHRISSTNWQNNVYKISGLPRDEPYTVNVMLYDDIDTMAVKLRW